MGETLVNLAHQTAFFNLTFGNVIMVVFGNVIMVVVALVLLYLAIVKEYEPLLLLPISFGMLLVNLYPPIMEEGGLLHYFFMLDEWTILPSLIFMGVGALTDFGPLIANPKSFVLGAAAQFGVFGAFFMAMAMGFTEAQAAAVSIIGGADGPTSIFCRSSVLIYGAGTDHSAAYHEGTHNRGREKDQDGAAPLSLQERKDPLPDHRNDRRMYTAPVNSSACRYADARQPLP